MGADFEWRQPPFEYVFHRLPIDLLNGSDAPRKWVESKGAPRQHQEIEQQGYPEYIKQRAEVLVYR